jgi:hypothetical protein
MSAFSNRTENASSKNPDSRPKGQKDLETKNVIMLHYVLSVPMKVLRSVLLERCGGGMVVVDVRVSQSVVLVGERYASFGKHNSMGRWARHV